MDLCSEVSIENDGNTNNVDILHRTSIHQTFERNDEYWRKAYSRWNKKSN